MSRPTHPPARRPAAFLAPAVTILALAAGGCGSSRPAAPPASAAPATNTSGTSPNAPAPTPAAPALRAAEAPSPSSFPRADGRSLQAIAGAATAQIQLGAATGTYVPGRQRLAFALTTGQGAFVLSPTAVYLARAPGAPATGPYLAPADPVTVAPEFRSRQNAGPGGLQAIYAAELPLPSPGTYTVLTLTRTPRGLLAAVGEVAVAAASPIPAVGQPAPAVPTDTPASVHGNAALLSTRTPPDDMHAVSLAQVLGHRPVALLFSTPALCVSRVCGPVTDVVVSLEGAFRDRIAFIHQEVYVGNDPRRGLRAPMRAFHLRTEPWLFTIDRHGRIAARLEGTFGTAEVRRALEAALR